MIPQNVRGKDFIMSRMSQLYLVLQEASEAINAAMEDLGRLSEARDAMLDAIEEIENIYGSATSKLL